MKRALIPEPRGNDGLTRRRSVSCLTSATIVLLPLVEEDGITQRGSLVDGDGSTQRGSLMEGDGSKQRGSLVEGGGITQIGSLMETRPVCGARGIAVAPCDVTFCVRSPSL